MRPSQAYSRDSDVALRRGDSQSTSIYGNDQRPRDSGRGNEHPNGRRRPNGDDRGTYCDGCHCFQRSRYRADIILRPLISQDGGAEASSSSLSSSSARVAASERRPIRDGDSGRERVLDRVHSAAGHDLIADRSKAECLKKLPASTRSSTSAYQHRRGNGPRSVWPWSWFRLLAVTLLVIFSFAALFDVGRCQAVLGDGQKGTVTSALSNSTLIPSGVNVSKVLAGDRRNRKDRHSRAHPRARRLDSDELNGGGNWAANGAQEEEEARQQKLSKAAFRQLSRMAFKALISEDFQDRALRPPDDDGIGGPPGTDDADLTVEGRRQIRRQQRKLQRQRQRQLRRQQLARRADDDGRGDGDGGDLLPPASDYNQQELVDQQDESSSADQNERRLPGRRRAIAIATKDSIKPDSCRTVPLKQRVRMTGCTTKIVVNHFCYGQCNSFYIPKLSKKRLRAAFESCSVCRPRSYAPVAITLHCPSRNPPYVKRKIVKVKDCSCMPANVSDNDVPQL